MKFILTFISTIFPVLISAQESQKQQEENGNVLNDVVIQETYQAEFEEEKLPLSLSIDFSDVLDIKERTTWKSVDRGNETNMPVLPHIHVCHPEFANIPPAPVKVFNVKMENISRWELQITASDGSVFRRITGEGNPPEQIEWDGKGEDGLPLIAGHTYAYNLTAVDKAGNKGTFPGQSFTIPAFYLQNKNTVLVGVAASRLLSTEGFGLAPEADAFAREIATFVRYFATQNSVSVFGQTPYLDEFLEIIRADLIVEESYFQKNKTKNTSRDAILFEIR